ncbi:MAG: hypothetical protein CL897_06780 [Dehalococcoidia bacterium]|nr:hypothetical protein [Dehalococcoidia bacterium]HCV00387.1 hypothetical protein [Dehalococcoidia bacterium]|tara:strand:+ start:11152 stop:11733 length:582 start_codon:yes stop_codon:yes gene_type:complete
MAIDILALLIAFLAGSVPFSWLLARYRYGVDLRATGDGNVGSGNLLHLGGIWLVVVATILDLLKGAIALAIVLAITGDEWVVLTGGGLVIAGHVLPPWLAFNGGRGASPAIGVAWALLPLSGLVMLGVGLIVLVGTRRTVVGIAAAVIALVAVTLAIDGNAGRLLFVVVLFLVVALKDVFDRFQSRRGRTTAK